MLVKLIVSVLAFVLLVLLVVVVALNVLQCSVNAV
jgi:hypothetical protein